MAEESIRRFSNPSRVSAAKANLASTHPKSNKRTPGEREQDLAEIATMYVRGLTLVQMSEELGRIRPYKLSRTQVFNDIKKIRAMWLDSAIMNFNEAKSRELAHIDQLERAYWEGWLASKEKKEKSTAETISDSTVSSRTNVATPKYTRTKGKKEVENRDGDPRFLEGIQWCVEQRCKILGLAPDRLEIADWRKEAERAGIERPGDVFEQLVQSLANAPSNKPPVDGTDGPGSMGRGEEDS